jgi:hypothetical protein
MCLGSVCFFLCPSRYVAALFPVPSFSGFSRGDLFLLLPLCFVRCGVGRGVARRAWCLAADGGTTGVLILVASCSWCVAYKCWLCFCLLTCWVLASFSACLGMLAPFLLFHHELLITRRSVLVASPLLCALWRWARRGAAGVVCGGGRRHGGRFCLGCILQRVRSL